MKVLRLLIVVWVTACAAGPVLPHREVAELFPQANSPPAECPGQYHETVFDGINFFLYCWGRAN